MPWKDSESRRAWDKAYYEKNREIINAKRIERYRALNPPKPKKPKRTEEELIAYRKAYYQKNRERLLKQAKEKYDPEYHKRYYQDNKEHIITLKKKWATENKEKLKQYAYAQQRKAFEKDPDKVRAQRRARKKASKAKDPQRYKEMANRSNRRVSKASVSELRDSYVRQLLCKHNVVKRLSAKEIPQGLVEAKRLEIQIRRLINEKRN